MMKMLIPVNVGKQSIEAMVFSVPLSTWFRV